jgi:hypothetical protein
MFPPKSLALLALALTLCRATTATPRACTDAVCLAERDSLPDLYEATFEELQAGMDSGKFTSVDLVKVCTTFALSHALPNAFVR